MKVRQKKRGRPKRRWEDRISKGLKAIEKKEDAINRKERKVIRTGDH